MTDALAGPDGTQAPDAPDALAAPAAAEDALAAPLPDTAALAWVRSLSDDEPAPTAPSPGPARPARRPVFGFDEDDDTSGADTVARLREERRRQALLHAEQARTAASRPGSGISAASVIAVLVVIAFVVVLALAG